MNAQAEVERLLKQDGATLERNNKHSVYRLSNGAQFYIHNTPSDYRAGLNALSDLRRLLKKERDYPTMDLVTEGGLPQPIAMRLQEVGATKAGGLAFRLPNGQLFVAAKIRRGDTQAQNGMLARLNRLIAAQSSPPPPTEPEPPPPMPPIDPIQKRIDTQIAEAEGEQHKLIEAAAVWEQRAGALRALREVIERMPQAEALLEALMAKPEPPKPEPPPPPPQVITERVQVNRQLVWAATQTFDREFRVDDVLNLMTQGHVVDEHERRRIRSSIAGGFGQLVERGELIQTQQGIGRRPAYFQKAEARVAAHV